MKNMAVGCIMREWSPFDLVAQDLRDVWLAMHRLLVLGQNAREVTVLDMTDYLNAVPTARVAWRMVESDTRRAMQN